MRILPEAHVLALSKFAKKFAECWQKRFSKGQDGEFHFPSAHLQSKLRKCVLRLNVTARFVPSIFQVAYILDNDMAALRKILIDFNQTFKMSQIT